MTAVAYLTSGAINSHLVTHEQPQPLLTRLSPGYSITVWIDLTENIEPSNPLSISCGFLSFGVARGMRVLVLGTAGIKNDSPSRGPLLIIILSILHMLCPHPTTILSIIGDIWGLSRRMNNDELTGSFYMVAFPDVVRCLLGCGAAVHEQSSSTWDVRYSEALAAAVDPGFLSLKICSRIGSKVREYPHGRELPSALDLGHTLSIGVTVRNKLFPRPRAATGRTVVPEDVREATARLSMEMGRNCRESFHIPSARNVRAADTTNEI
ncbi:hypothetical protein BJV74DRAFT_990565 [Russula compacta]|nr:hypothetical protein BJV74DRAFT_990565 [Russula compacta]